MVNDTPLTRAEWIAVSAEAWRDRMNEEWARPLVSLAGATYWIATRGDPSVEPDDAALEWAAGVLLAALRDASVKAYGYNKMSISPFLELVGADVFLAADGFIPTVSEIDALNNGEPHLLLNLVLERTGRDFFARHFDDVLIDRLVIRRADMLHKWPAGNHALRQACEQIIASHGVIDQKEALKLARSFGLICTREQFLSAWKPLAGPQKRGPRGPRKISPSGRANSG